MKRVKLIEQTTPTECGLCCIFMLLQFHGMKGYYFDFKQRWLTGRDGLTYLNLKQIANLMGYEAKVYRMNSLPHALPALIHINGNHFVLIEAINKGTLSIVDPAVGQYQIKEKEFYELQPKNYLVITEASKIVKQEPTSSLSKIKPFKNAVKNDFIDNNKVTLLTLSIITLFFQIVAFIVPFLIRWIMDNQTKALNNFGKLLILIIILTVIQVLFRYIKNIIINKLQNESSYNLGANLVKNILSWSMQNISTMNKKDIVHRYNGLVIVQELLSERIISLVLDLIIMLASFIYLAYTSLAVGIFLMVTTLVEVAIYFFTMNKKNSKLSKEVLAQRNTLETFMQLSENLTLIKSKNVENIMFNKWSKKYRSYIESVENRNKYNEKILSIQYGITLLVPLLSILVLVTGKLSINAGEILAVYIMISNYITPLNNILNSVDEVLYNIKFYQRVVELRTISKEKAGAIMLNHVNDLDIALDNVTYSYGKFSKKILIDISLDIRQSEFVAIIGKSGEGKSTLGKVILSHIDPSKGVVRYNSQPADLINKKSLREITALVRQDNEIVDGSIYFNITLGCDFFSEERIIEVCQEVGILKEIQALPMGFATMLSKDDPNLSGGQAQRISLARALLNRPKLIVMDEPTSSLDIYNEAIVQKSIEELKCTRVLITHRLNTIINADKIIILDHGKIQALGRHEELYETNPEYKYKFDAYMSQYQRKKEQYGKIAN